MQLEPNHVHVWLVDLTISSTEESKRFTYLSHDERERAERFHTPLLRKRFIAARYALRKIVSDYLQTSPDLIRFEYNEYGKPQLADKHAPLQFNLTHSDDMALCALTLNHAIGVDIEKMIERGYIDIAQRFFSAQENQALAQLPAHEKMAGFYCLWARKEALTKALGKGLHYPLTDFSVSPQPITEVIKVENNNWTIMSLETTPDYQAAIASNQPIKDILVSKF